MRHANYCVMDEFLPGASSSAPAYTSTKYQKRLAHFDTLVLQVVIDNFTGIDTFKLQIEHSADGRSFSPWNTVGPDIATSVTPGSAVLVASVPAAAQTQPLLGFVRFSMYFVGAMAAHVRIYVTQRDAGG
jgi:hypothetical protein